MWLRRHCRAPGYVLDDARGPAVGKVATYRLNPADPAFTKDAGWDDAFDDLRVRPRKRGERLGDWRRDAPIRSIAFSRRSWPTAVTPRTWCRCILSIGLVRRLLSRFLSQGFQSKLSRVSVIYGPGAQPRVVLMGRLAVFGAGAARLHEEVIPITAIWTEAERDRKPLRPLGESGEEKTLNQLEEALRDAREASGAAVARIQALVAKDIADLVPALEKIAAERLATVSGATSEARRGGGALAVRPARTAAVTHRQGGKGVRSQSAHPRSRARGAARARGRPAALGRSPDAP